MIIKDLGTYIFTEDYVSVGSCWVGGKCLFKAGSKIEVWEINLVGHDTIYTNHGNIDHDLPVTLYSTTTPNNPIRDEYSREIYRSW